MAGTIYSGTYTTGIVLSNPATQRPVTVTASGKITDTNADAIYGSAAFAWNIVNRGTIESTGTAGYGIHLAGGGTITNIAAGVGPTATGGFIEGYGGILIEGLAGAVTNLGTIEGAGANTNGVLLTAGGSVTNGSATNTTALISDARHGVKISGGVGTVTNFGTIENADTHSNVILATGTVINGSSGSTAALITGSGEGIYINDGTGTVVNFATIKSVSAISLLHGGRVANGAVGSTAAQIVGTAGIDVFIQGAAGTVANFATIEATTSSAAIEMLAGGTIVNGSAADATALITNTAAGTAIYFGSAPGTVTSFGTIDNTGTGFSFVISLAAGGSVTNGSSTATGALIEGVGSGISISGGSGTVANFGTIETAGSSLTAISASGGGSIVNGKSGSTIGLIEGLVSLSGGPGAITNYGTIAAANLAASAGTGDTITNVGAIKSTAAVGTVIELIGGATLLNAKAGIITTAGVEAHAISAFSAPATITNLGLISVTGTFAAGIGLSGGGTLLNSTGGVIASAGVAAVSAYSAPATITNLGTISATGTSGPVVTAVALDDGGSVVNGKSGSTIGLIEGEASLSGGPGAITNYGTITATNLAANAGAAETITNVGVIKSTGTKGFAAVGLSGGGTLLNSSAGVITSTGAEAVSGVSATIVNLGTIDSTAKYGSAISLGAGAVTNGRSGSSMGLIEGGTGFSTGMSIGTGMVTNFGTIVGAIGFEGIGVGNTTLINYGTVASTSAFAAVDMLSGLGNKLVIEEPGSVLKGLVEGGGRGEIEFLGAGTANMTGVSGFETILLGNGIGHSLTLTDANFSGVAPIRITVFGGNAGNTIDASAVTATLPLPSLVVHGGAGKDVLTGGAGNDVFVFTATALTAGDTISGGGGTRNELQVTTAAPSRQPAFPGSRSISWPMAARIRWL